MGRYIDWDDAANRYGNIGKLDAEDISSSYIVYAEAEIESKLAPKFAAPFSSNNITVRDLCIDTVLKKVLMFKDTKKADTSGKDIDARVKALLEGNAQMALDDGTTTGQDVQSAWSETSGYAPTFGVGDITDMQVSSARLYSEETARD